MQSPNKVCVVADVNQISTGKQIKMERIISIYTLLRLIESPVKYFSHSERIIGWYNY